MPKKKQLGLAEGVENSPVNSTLPENVTLVFLPNQIASLELDLGREDLNKVVDKINELIKKVNQ